MLSFKNNQNAQPLFDYYLETDLDSFDDQPVDYSKKYADQDSYEDCRRTKSVLKTNEFPTEVSQTIKQSSSDEVKVYCIEGTPLTISSASSFCDLREVGTSNAVEKSDMKPSYSSINDSGSPESFEVDDIKKCNESSCDKKEETSPSKEKDDMKEGKSVSFRSSNDISKASSPLMFSRSSSIASLNSFEQQSIVDDRSSVSVFSALTSGLISPSDLPDSPGEVMSPALTDKASSPKIDVTKIDCNNECDSIGFSANDKVDTKKADNNNTNNQIPGHAQLLKTKEYIPVDSYKSVRNSEEENDILVERLEVSNDSVDIDEVFDNPEYEKSSLVLQDEEVKKNIEGVLLEHIESDEKEPITNHSKEEEISKEFNEVDDELKTSEIIQSLDDEDSDDDDELLQHCIELGMPQNRITKSGEECIETPYLPHSAGYNSGNSLYSPPCSKSDDDSDADDILLEKCIQLGMPNKSSKEKESRLYKRIERLGVLEETNTSQVEMSKDVALLNKNIEESDGIANILKHSNEREIGKGFSEVDADIAEDEMKTLDLARSVEDSDDDDDELLQHCIKLGMPQNTSNRKSTGGCIKTTYLSPSAGYISGNDLYIPPCDKSDDDSDADDILLQNCIKLGMPSISSREKDSRQKYKRIERHDVLVKANTSPVSRKVHPMKVDADSDGDETDMHLEHCFQMGMHKESCRRKELDKEVFRKSEYNPHPTNDLRDNCPDGISDGDEEDEMLENCIRAGMPSPKTASDIQTKLYASQTGNSSRKVPLPNRSFLSDNSTDLNKKFCHPRLPQNQPYAPVHSSTTWLSSTSFIDVDSMRIYRTEDTPILSPSASISDLSSLSFNESFLNNSRNSDCSSDSDDDDELLLQCIRSGMPEARRAVA